MFRRTAVLVFLLAVGSQAVAHDFWLQPQSWQATAGKVMPFVVEVGHGSFRQQWGADGGHLLELRDLANGGSIDIRKMFVPGGRTPHLSRAFNRPGLHVISLVSTNAASNLPSIRFNDYVKAEGLTAVIDARARSGATNSNGRELYSRRAKALVQVGSALPGDSAIAMKPLGLTLEIVPLRDPYALGDDRALPVSVLFRGKPLAGALVKLTSLEFDERPLQSVRTDANGKAIFKVPPVGSWLVNVIWSQPIRSADADYQTIFSSLTFGYPAKRGR